MNTPNEWLTTATATTPERAAEWQEVFGNNVVPVLSFIPSLGTFPGVGEAYYYPLDLRAITPEQKERLIASIARRFGLAPKLVRAEIDRVGVPILADDVTVSSRDSGLFFSIVGGDDNMMKESDGWDSI